MERMREEEGWRKRESKKRGEHSKAKSQPQQSVTLISDIKLLPHHYDCLKHTHTHTHTHTQTHRQTDITTTLNIFLSSYTSYFSSYQICSFTVEHVSTSVR